MRAHVWFVGNFVLLLHRTAILSAAYDKQSIFSVKQLSIKTQCYFLESLQFTSFKNTISYLWKPEKWKTGIIMYFK